MSNDKKVAPSESASTSAVTTPTRPKEITPENVHLADFDNLNVKLLCIVKNARRFESVSGFLSRRGWEVEVTENVRDAMKLVATSDPDYLLVSMNANNKNIVQLPQIAMRTLQVETIAFGEATDTKTIQLLHTTQAGHKIMGLVSGPSLQRRIKQIIKKKHRVEGADSSSAAEGQEGTEEGSLHAHGTDRSLNRSRNQSTSGPGKNDKDGPGYIMFQKDKTPSDSARRGYMPSIGNENDMDQSEGAQNVEGTSAGNDYSGPNQSSDGEDDLNAMLNQVLSETKDSNSVKGKGDSKSSTPFGQIDPRGEKGAATSKGKPNAESVNTGAGPDAGGTDAKKTAPADPKGATPTFAAKTKQKQNGLQEALKELSEQLGKGELKLDDTITSPERQATEGASENQRDGGGRKENQAPVIESEYIGRRKKDSGKKISPADRSTLLEKLVIASVDNLFGQEKPRDPQIGHVAEVASLVLNHKDASGLLLVVGNNLGADLEKITLRLKSEMIKQAQESKQHLATTEVFSLTLESYDFFLNDEPGLLFNYVRSTEKGEFAVKFLTDADAWAEVEPSTKDKATVKIEQIQQDRNLDFDLFIYLKKNKKFYKIVSEGSALSGERKERMKNDRVPTFINKQDEMIYRVFSARERVAQVLSQISENRKISKKSA